jgi:hypothetical protein
MQTAQKLNSKSTNDSINKWANEQKFSEEEI